MQSCVHTESILQRTFITKKFQDRNFKEKGFEDASQRIWCVLVLSFDAPRVHVFAAQMEALATSNMAHHLLLYGCDAAYTPNTSRYVLPRPTRSTLPGTY